MNRLVHTSNSPYDLSGSYWVCGKCGGRIRSNSPYEPMVPNARYCNCKK